MFKIKTKKGTWGETVRVYIVDSKGKVVWSDAISAASNWMEANTRSRKKKVGQLKSAAQEQLNTLNQQKDVADTSTMSGGRVTLGDDGLYHTEDGRAFESRSEAEDHISAIDTKTEFDSDIKDYEDRIKDAGREREELASRISARKQGQLMSQMQRAILGSGGEQAQVEAMIPKIQESGERSLQDYLTQSKAKTKESLVGAKGLDIKGDFDLESLGLKRDALTDAMTKFLMEEETDRAKIQASIDMQPEWWETALSQFTGGVGESAGKLGMARLFGLV